MIKNFDWSLIFNTVGSKNINKVKNILKKHGFKKKFKIINIVGTNGKGTVSKVINDNLINNNYKVGLFTSPHLIDPLERIKINNQNINKKDFFRLYNLIKNENLSFFSIFFVISMIYFCEQEIDYVIVEAGIGGNKDITKAVPGDFGLLTKVSFDHENILGNNLKQIAREKIGIKNPKMKLFIPSQLKRSIKRKVKKEPNIFVLKNSGKTFIESNFKLAKNFLKKALNLNPTIFNLPKGRFDIIKHKEHHSILDVSHNEDGIKALLKLLKKEKIDFQQIVICLNKSKSHDQIAKLFKNKKVYFYKFNEDFIDFSFLNWKQISNIKSFFKKQTTNTLYLGSFKMIGEIYENICKK